MSLVIGGVQFQSTIIHIHMQSNKSQIPGSMDGCGVPPFISKMTRMCNNNMAYGIEPSVFNKLLIRINAAGDICIFAKMRYLLYQ